MYRNAFCCVYAAQLNQRKQFYCVNVISFFLVVLTFWTYNCYYECTAPSIENDEENRLVFVGIFILLIMWWEDDNLRR